MKQKKQTTKNNQITCPNCNKTFLLIPAPEGTMSMGSYLESFEEILKCHLDKKESHRQYRYLYPYTIHKRNRKSEN